MAIYPIKFNQHAPNTIKHQGKGNSCKNRLPPNSFNLESWSKNRSTQEWERGAEGYKARLVSYLVDLFIRLFIQLLHLWPKI